MEYPVTIHSNGNKLYGIYHECEDSKVTIITLHGLGGTRIDVHRIFVTLARRLEKYKISCLRVDLTGSGISQGNFIDFTFKQQYIDLENVLAWIRSRRNNNKVFLLGFSDGAIVAYNAGVRNDYISGMILWSPKFSHDSNEKTFDNNKMSKRLYKVEGQLAWPILGHWVYKEYFEDKNKQINALDFKQLQKKCIAIYGENDKDVKYVIEKIDCRFLEKKEIKEANHLYFSPIWTEQVINITIDWILENL